MNNNVPLFSVIVPVYKTEAYLDQCVRSILAQSFHDFELILVDDGSPDKCHDMCDDYARKDNRISVIHKANSGLVSARKTGLIKSSGRYIVCVDSDDWVACNYLQLCAQVIDLSHPDIICCGSIWHYDTGKEVIHQITNKEKLYLKEDIEREIFPELIESIDGRYFAPNIWSKVFERNLYKTYQLAVDDKIKIGEDLACVKPCIFYSQSIYLMPQCLYYYRQNTSSMTKNKAPFDPDVPRLIGQHFEKYIDMQLQDFQEQVYRNVVHNLFNMCVSQYNHKKSRNAISKDICMILNEPYYQKAISLCRYKKNWKGILALNALRYRLFYLMYLYNLYLRVRH